jgi:hypothetical protein
MPQSRERWASSTGALWSLRPDPVKYWVDHTSVRRDVRGNLMMRKPSSRNTSPLSLWRDMMPVFSATAA